MQHVDTVFYWASGISGILAIVGLIYSSFKTILARRKKKVDEFKKWRNRSLVLFSHLFLFGFGIFIGWLRFAPMQIVIDDFEDQDVEERWQPLVSDDGDIEFATNSDESSPDAPGNRSLRIETTEPCSAEGERYSMIQHTIPEEERNWSDSEFLELWIRSDGSNAPPWGGELSIIITDADDEEWWYQEWIHNRSGAWERISISLRSNRIGDPWEDAGFVIPVWPEIEENDTERIKDQQLDLSEIKRIDIQARTSRDWACGEAEGPEGEEYPELTIWIDHITRR